MCNKIFVNTIKFFVLIILMLASFNVLPATARAAALLLHPGRGDFLVGSTFNLSIILDTKNVSINTIETELFFSPTKLQLASPSIGKSIIQLWPTTPVFSNTEGRIYFVGAVPSPGINASDGVVLTLTFRVISPGEGEIKFGEKTSVLANDGKGTDLLIQKSSAFFKFLIPPPQGPAISSPTHPDQERWYKDNNPTFIWSRGIIANKFSYLIDHDPSGIPDTSSEGMASTISFNNLDNGIWYFHLRAAIDDVWGGVSSYVLKIDNQSPAAFAVNVSPGKRTSNRNPIFRFFTTDSLSGFSHFEMKMIRLSGIKTFEAFFYEVSNPYQAINIEPGRYQVVVRAYDDALNSRDESVTINIIGPLSKFIDSEGVDLIVFFLPWNMLINVLLLILIIFIIIIFLLLRKHRHHLKHAFLEDIERFFTITKNVSNKIKRQPPSLLIIMFAVIGLSILLPHITKAVEPAPTRQVGVPISFSANVGVEPPEPVISVAPSQFYPLDEILFIEGRAAPKAKIAVNFEKLGSKSVTIIVESNSNGEWFLAQKVELSSGEWTARARILGDPASDWSSPRIIRSTVSGFIFGSIKIKYFPIAIALILLLLSSTALLAYLLWQISKVRRSAHLREDISDELEHLEKAIREGKELSESEMKRRENLLLELRHAEEIIQDKFKEI